ncbi:MAG TPA: hypothetical protein VHF69_10080, partial [Candidatus Synoicihabitans sp.]|nr:hypothetical protein [Candidatus Synoicihabitans sp.]
VYLGTGSIFYLGIGLGRLLGEDVLARDRRGNFFDRIFLGALGSALCVFAIAIPFGIRDPSAVPLAVGVLSGIMWLPMSVLLGHWVGYFHALTRSALLVTAWYVFPNDRFVALPLVIVAVYVVSLCALQARWQALQPTAGRPPGRSSARRRLLLSLAMGVGLGSSLGVALDNAAVGASVGIAGAMVFYVVRCRPLS